MTQQHDPETNKDDNVRYRVEVSAPGFRFSLGDEDSWQTVAKIIVLILAVYGGIHLINYYL